MGQEPLLSSIVFKPPGRGQTLNTKLSILFTDIHSVLISKMGGNVPLDWEENYLQFLLGQE